MNLGLLLDIFGVITYGMFILYFVTFIVYIWFNRQGNWETFHALPEKGIYIKTAATLMVVLTIPCVWVLSTLLPT